MDKHNSIEKRQNPWRGAASYDDPQDYKDGEEYLFCGRNDETYDLMKLIERKTIITLYGQTGVGKTSLLKAGVFPRLRSEGYYPVYIRFSEKPNLEQFAAILVEELCSKLVVKNNAKDDVKRINAVDDNLFLWQYFHTHSFFLKSEDSKHVVPVIVLDQFEEVFNTGKDDKKVRVFLEQVHELVDNQRIGIDLQGFCQDINFRIVLSLRDDRLFYLEDVIDSYRLVLLKENRYRLRNLSEDKARDVIGEPGEKSIVDADLSIIESKIIDAARNEDQSISSLMLSVICAQLYDGLEGDEKISLEKVGNLNYTLSAFYEEKIREIPSKERKYIERELVNGWKRRSVPKKEFDQAAPNSVFLYNDKVVSRRILTKFPMPGSGDEHIEFIHDRIAEVVKQRKEDLAARHRHIMLYFLLAAIVALSLFATFYLGSNSMDKNRLMSNLVKCDDHYFTTNDTLWVDQERISRNALVETFAIFDKSEYAVENCPYLSVIDLSKLGRDTLKLTLHNCPVLANISLPDSIQDLHLNIHNCPNLQIHINRGLGNLKINIDSGSLTFRIDNDVDRYVWYDKILWDIERKKILYANTSQGNYAISNNGNSINCRFPSAIRENQMNYDGKTFINTNYDVADVNLENRGGSGHNYKYNHNPHDTIHRQDVGRGDDYVILPDSMALIENSLFYKCPKLTRVDMPVTLERIEDNAFNGCRLLTNIELPPTLTYIGNSAFKGCLHLKELVIPQSVTEIGASAFEGCSSLEKVVFQGHSIRIGARAFANCSALSDIQMPALCDYSTDNYFSHPFLNCPLVNKELSNKAEAPRTIVKSGHTRFVSGDYILLDDQDYEIRIPPLRRCTWTFDREPLYVTDIYVPYPQPDVVDNNYKNEKAQASFRLNLDNDLKGGITLHVPYGCKRYYESVPDFSDFRQIEEMSEWEARKGYIEYLANLVVTTLQTWRGATYLVIYFCLAIVGFNLAKRQKKDRTTLKSRFLLYIWAFLYPLFISLAALSFFWFLRHLVGWTEFVSAIVAIIMALLMVTWCYLLEFCGLGSLFGMENTKKEMKSGKRNYSFGFFSSSQFLSVWNKLLRMKWCIWGIALFLFFLLGIVGYCSHRPNDMHTALSQGKYELALQYMTDRVLETDTLSSTDIHELRQMLIKSGLQPRYVKDALLDCDDFYSWGGATLTAVCGDTLHCWYNGVYAKWPIKSIYGQWKYNGGYCAFDKVHKLIVHYDAQNDTSSIFDMNSPQYDSNPKLQLKGRVVGSNLTGPLFWTEKDRIYLLSDYQGRTVSLPQEFYKDSIVSYRERDGLSVSTKSIFTSLLSLTKGDVASVSLKERGKEHTNRYIFGESNKGPVIYKLKEDEIFEGFLSGGKYVVLNCRIRKPSASPDDWDEEKIRVCTFDQDLTTIKEFDFGFGSTGCNGDVLVVPQSQEKFSVFCPDHSNQVVDLEGRYIKQYKHIVYYLKDGQYCLYNIDNERQDVIEAKYYSAHAGSLFLGDFLILYDNTYGVAHAFTFNNMLRHIDEIRADRFEYVHAGPYLKVFRGDSLQYYHIDDKILPGAILPRSLNDAYRQGDFLTPHSYEDQQTTYRIYPLRDELDNFYFELSAQKGESRITEPIVTGDYILQTIRDERGTKGQILRMRYEGLQDMVLRSCLNNDRKKKLINSLKKSDIR